MDFRGSSVLGLVYAPNITVKGDVRFDGLHVGKYGRLQPAVWMRGANIGGRLYLGALTKDHAPPGYPGEKIPRPSEINGNLDVTRATIEGNVILRGTSIHGSADFRQARISGSVLAEPKNETSPDDDLRTCRFVVRGQACFDFARIDGRCDLSGAHITENVSLRYAKIAGVLIGREHDMRPVHAPLWLKIEGCLDLTGAKINVVELRGAQLSDLKAITGEFGWFQHSAGVWVRKGGDKLIPQIQRPTAKSVILRLLTVRENIDFAGIRVTGFAVGDLDGNEAGRDSQPSFILAESTIGGNVHLSRDGLAQRTLLMKKQGLHLDFNEFANLDHKIRAEMKGILDLRALKIGGQMELSNVDVDGDIRLEQTTIGRDFLMSSFARGAFGVRRMQKPGVFEAECKHLNIEMVTCEGDADLTGLNLHGYKDDQCPGKTKMMGSDSRDGELFGP